MENWWNDNDRAKQKYYEKKFSQCHFVHYEPKVDWPGIEPGSPGSDAGDLLTAPGIARPKCPMEVLKIIDNMVL